MKRICITLLVLIVCVGYTQAQDIDKFFNNARIRQDLALTDKEVNDLRDAWAAGQKAIQIADADREVKASELKRLLLDPKVDMAAVQKTLHEGMELEYKVRMAQIERTIKAREILGPERWARLQKYLRGLRARARTNTNPRTRDNRARRNPSLRRPLR